MQQTHTTKKGKVKYNPGMKRGVLSAESKKNIETMAWTVLNNSMSMNRSDGMNALKEEKKKEHDIETKAFLRGYEKYVEYPENGTYPWDAPGWNKFSTDTIGYAKKHNLDMED